MKFNKIMGSLALLASAVVSSGAEAATYNLGVLGATPTFKLAQVAPGAFADTFNFTISSLSDTSTSVNNHKLVFGGFGTALDITGLSMSLFNSSNTQIAGPVGDGVSTFNANLAAGAYHANVTGTATGFSGGYYSVSAIAQPVPVPAALWLLGSGLIGLVGVARRKDLVV